MMVFRLVFKVDGRTKEEYINENSWQDALNKYNKTFADASQLMSISDCTTTRRKLTSKGRIKLIHD